ncbi:MAG TPA: PP2C family serine/threonine-protein phosphatase [Blastocatellia bacterium]|nr:PP2C family serine/threonine-protein phosphatase [Blastocatellia bacterium]
MPEEIGFNIEVYAKTDVGLVRSGNEDNFLVLNLSTAETWTPDLVLGEAPPTMTRFAQGHYGTVLAVTDGMGGALAGEVASRLAVESVRDRMLELQASSAYSKFDFNERLRLAVELANLHIHYESLSHAEYSGMGATFTALGLFGATGFFAQVGDSRAYVFRGGTARQITRDQSLVGQLVEAGHLTEEEAEQHTYKNVILQALGASPYINVAVNKLPLRNGDVILLCSDGLSNKIRGEEMMRVIEEAGSLPNGCDALVKVANQRGGEDNITVMMARVTGDRLQGVESKPEGDAGPQDWNIETIQRDPGLPHEIEPDLLDGEEDTLPEA